MEQNNGLNYQPIDFGVNTDPIPFPYTGQSGMMNGNGISLFSPFDNSSSLDSMQLKSNNDSLSLASLQLDHVFGNNSKAEAFIKNEKDEEKSESTSPISKDSGHQRKRTRASAEQLAILEEAFAHNSSPNSRTREMLAEKVNMTERSVQIWFQNRRAKVKLIQKRNYMLQEEALKHQMLAVNYMNHSPFTTQSFSMPYTTGYSIMGGDMGMMSSTQANLGAHSLPYQSNFGHKMSIQTRSLSLGSITSPFMNNDNKGVDNVILGGIQCECLSIGSWRRRTVQKGDLACLYNLSQRQLTWQICDGGMRFKMDIPFSAVVSISLKAIEELPGQGQIVFDTNQIPSFYMETNFQGQSIWNQCRDFTEGTQASRFFKHTLYGPLNVLKADLSSLITKDINLRNITKMPGELSPTYFSENEREPMIEASILATIEESNLLDPTDPSSDTIGNASSMSNML